MSEEILDQLAADMKTLLSEPAGSRRVKITDLTPRDGQQCKLATRVTTDDSCRYVPPSTIAVSTRWKCGAARRLMFACAISTKIRGSGSGG